MYSRFRSLCRPCVIGILICAPPSSVSSAQNTPDFSSLASAAAGARESGKYQEAIRLYRQAVGVRPEWTEGWWYLGTLSYDADRFADSITALRRVTELAPELGAAWSFLGLSEFEIKNYPAARSDLEKGITLGNTDDPAVDRVARFHLAQLHIRSGEFDRAQTLLVPQFTAPPVPEQVRVALGLLLLRVPLLPQEIDPSKDALLSAAGDLQLQLIAEKAGNALATMQSLVSRAPEKQVTHEILARCYDALRMPAEAAKERAAVNGAQSAPAGESSDQRLAVFFSRVAASTDNATAAEKTNSLEFDELVRRAGSAERSADARAAIPLYERALELRPEWGEGRWNLSMLYYSAKQFREAAASLELWLERNPNSGTGWAVLGLSEFEVHDYENALIHLQRGDSLGLGASADSIRSARYHEAILLNRKSEFARAAQILSAEAGSGVLQKEIAFALGMAFLRIPHFPEELLIAQRPLVERTGAAAALLADSKYDLALPKLRELLREFPQAPFLHYVYGSALSSLSMFDEAATQFEAETRISPQSELPLVELALLSLQRHSAKEAVASARRAVQLAPSSATAHYVLGRGYLEAGDLDSAAKVLEIAAKMSPGSPEIHFHLARAYARQNLPEKAEEERVIFARLNALAEQRRSATGSQSYGAVRPANP
jgi:tetratricopeptide (TPR) repeat protein